MALYPILPPCLCGWASLEYSFLGPCLFFALQEEHHFRQAYVVQEKRRYAQKQHNTVFMREEKMLGIKLLGL